MLPNPLHAARDDQYYMERLDILTTREREITHLIGKGLKNRAIADRLCISETTVRHHLTSIFSKLDLRDRQQLLIWAHQRKLIDLSVTTDVTQPDI
jgi:DNA-binding NarL/FixJ family response regulator